jgi:[NiFe] hydrogenase assembly HybE family chaperone
MNAQAMPSPATRLRARSDTLAAHFAEVARTRMAGVPVLNPALRVEAVGFARWADEHDAPESGLGILITPWFMNLVRLPLLRDEATAGIGCTRRHAIGGRTFEFIGAHEASIGAFAACSLFSPMFEFAEQARARDTASAVLAELRDTSAVATPARRSFLFGRASSAGERA